jgi:hypothetical protein
MIASIPQSVTCRIPLKAYLSSDHVSAATGKTIAVVISKNGAAFANPSAGATNATEISSGWYYVDLSTTDTGTKGPLIIRGTATGVDDVETHPYVVDAHNAGFDGVPSAAAAAAGGLPVLGTNATAISFTAGMTISSTTGNALALTSSGGNGDGLAATGNGTGAGIHLVPGATGNGLLAIGGATSGSAIKATGTAGNAIALELAGQGSAAGLSATGGATGIGITAIGGATSGSGLKAAGTAGNAIALEIAGQGSAAGIQATGGATGSAFKLVGGATSGHGLAVTTTSGDGFNLTPTAGNAITATANGTSKHGIVATGGTAGTSDGASFVAGTGGVDFRANRTGNLTGDLSGSVGSVTGAVGSVTGSVGSVTGAVGSVTGAVGSVTGNVGGNVTGSVGSVTAVVSLSASDSPVVQSGTAQAGGASTITLSGSASATDNLYNGQTVKTIAGTGPAQVRVITGYVGSTKVATVDRAWATNPDITTTYAVLATDLAKTNSSLEVVSASVTGAVGSVTGSVGSVTGAVGSVTGAVGSVTGNVGGNVVGSVASVTADVGITQAGADKVWSTSTRALTDKVGFALSSAGVQAIWDALTSALSTVGSIGKLIVTNLDAAISSRSTYAGGDTSGVTTLLGRLTSTRATNLDNLDAAVSTRSTYAGADTAGTTTLLGRLTAPRSANLDNLDATVSSRSTYAGGAVASVTAAVTVGTNNDKTGYGLSAAGVDDIWDELTSGHTTAGTTGKALIDAGATGADPWDTLLPGSYAAGSAGDIVGRNLDVTVSSRSTYAGADTSGTTTLLGRLTSTRAGLLDNLDAAVSTRSSHSAADVWAVGTRTLTAFTIAVDITSAAASLIWDKLLTGITTASSIGKLIKDNLDAAVSTRSTYAGGDTSGTTTLLGRLTSTRAGNLDNLDAAVSTRSTFAGGAVASVTAPVTVGTNNDKTGYSLAVTPPTAVQIRTEMDLNSTKLANLDATVSSRSTYAGADTAGTTTLLGRLTSGRSANLDNLDVAVSTRSSHAAADVWAVTTRTLSSFGALVSDTTTAVWGAASRTLTAFGFSVTATVSDKTGYSLTTAYDAAKTALPSSSYVAPDNAGIAAIKAKTDNLPFAPAAYR